MSSSSDRDRALAQAIERIAPLEARPVQSALTGDAAALSAWWSGEPVADRVLTSPADASVQLGLRAADAAADEGINLVIPRVSERDPITSLTVIGLLSNREPQHLIPRDMPDGQWMEQCAAVRDAMASTTIGDDYLALANEHIAFIVGVLLGAAARRTRCLIDGTDELAAALIASRLAFRSPTWWRAASTSSAPARRAAIERISLDYAIDLKTSGDDDIAIQSALAVLRVL